MIVSDLIDINGTRCVCISADTFYTGSSFFTGLHYAPTDYCAPTEQIITCKRNFYSLKIYFDDVLHLEVRMDNHDGLSSWFEDSGKQMYCIELYRKLGSPILLEYDEKYKWTNILKVIDENI